MSRYLLKVSEQETLTYPVQGYGVEFKVRNCPGFLVISLISLACPLQRYQSVSHSPAALASPWADRSVA